MLLRTLVLLGLTFSFGCGQDAENPPPAPEGAVTLELEYISGHLGGYGDCPDQAMESREQARAPAIAGDCAEDTNCGGFLNCEVAAVTLRITNTGDAAVHGVTVKHLHLVWDGADVESEVQSILDTMGDAFDGHLEAGESIDVQVNYRGPHPNDVAWDEGLPATLEVGVGEDCSELVTPELQSIPQVAT